MIQECKSILSGAIDIILFKSLMVPVFIIRKIDTSAVDLGLNGLSMRLTYSKVSAPDVRLINFCDNVTAND